MKKFLMFLLAFALVLPSVVSLRIPAFAESMYVKKIVSVVYDDSGSMRGDKWAYANYAMQAFSGMLNDGDSLYITYMSDVKSGNTVSRKTDLSAKGLQGTVDEMRNHKKECDSTPFSAVEVAFNTLKNEGQQQANTQYWLVVITDGAFDECIYMSNSEKKAFLNDKFTAYASETMPNGTNPNITFMAIGDGVATPDNNESKKIYSYTSNSAVGITSVMSDMAAKVSGRTIVSKSSMSQPDRKTIRVSSAVPLLNIAVFSQDTSAKLVSVSAGSKKLSVTRKVSLDYPGYDDLTAGAYLVENSKKMIEKGTYDIVFDGDVDASGVDILYEPALEVKVSAIVDGKEITDAKQLENVPVGKDVTVMCKVYEMGTGKEIEKSALPAGTNFEIQVYENGDKASESNGEEPAMNGYVMKNSETEIRAAVTIDGFNPIGSSIKFKPGRNAKYMLTPDYKNNVRSVRYKHIANNKDMAVYFTISHEGNTITNPEAVKSFDPQIKVSPDGNGGSVEISNDGKIVYTPNVSSPLSDDDDNLAVKVSCSLNNGVSATADYTVVVAEYEAVAVDEAVKIAKNEFYGNTKGVSFYILRDGVKLGASDVGNLSDAVANDEYSHLKFSVNVEPDGKITVVPYSEDEHKINFWNWWFNWLYYFGLEKDDLEVTLRHPLASGESTIDVTEADLKYLILNVILPLLIELLLILAIVAYIGRYITKARFAEGAALYVGSIVRYSSHPRTHIMEMSACELSQYNTFANLWNPFKELTVSVNGVSITAVAGGKIMCNEAFPWYSDTVIPKSRTIQIDCPKDISDYCDEKSELMINEIKTINVMDEQNRIITQDDSVYYFVKADVDYTSVGSRQTEVIEEAVVFCYSTV